MMPRSAPANVVGRRTERGEQLLAAFERCILMRRSQVQPTLVAGTHRQHGLHRRDETGILDDLAERLDRRIRLGNVLSAIVRS